MTTCNLKSHITDSRFFSRGYATAEARQVFCDLRRMQRWLQVECALAECQAELGIIPKGAAKKIIASAKLELIDLHSVQNELVTTSHSLIPLLNAWQKATEGEAGQFIHYGATTQDIQDTSQSLELLEIIQIIERDLTIVIQSMTSLAAENRNLVMVGRTHGQPALPTTLGLKIAGWLDEAIRNFDRLQVCKKSVLVSQLFGGVGTMSALSNQAEDLHKRFSARLGLTPPNSNWHNSRDRSAEYLAVLAIICGSLARAANEIYQLAKIEIGELAEPFTEGQVGSSTMPHKVNPETCEQVVVLARLVKANASLGFDALINEHERDYRAVRIEWVSVADASLYTCTSLSLMKKILQGLVVNQERITTNLEQQAHLISTEALMFKLGENFGKQTAHALIYKASIESNNTGVPMLEILVKDPQVGSKYTIKALKEIIVPSDQVGMAGKLVDKLVKISHKRFPHGVECKEEPCPLQIFCSHQEVSL